MKKLNIMLIEDEAILSEIVGGNVLQAIVTDRNLHGTVTILKWLEDEITILIKLLGGGIGMTGPARGVGSDPWKVAPTGGK